MAPDDEYNPSPFDYFVKGVDHTRVLMVVACLFLAADTGFSLHQNALKGIALGLLAIGEYIKLREEGVDERIRGDELIRLDEPKDLYKEVDRRLKEHRDKESKRMVEESLRHSRRQEQEQRPVEDEDWDEELQIAKRGLFGEFFGRLFR